MLKGQKRGYKTKNTGNMKYSLGKVSVNKVFLDFKFFALVWINCWKYNFDIKQDIKY